MSKKQEEAEEREESEARAEARAFILSAIERGWGAEDILDELTSFFDGDPLDLF